MRKQTNRCTCASACEQFELNDTYKSIACRTCYEIISYEIVTRERVERVKSKHVRGTIVDFVNVIKKFRVQCV